LANPGKISTTKQHQELMVQQTETAKYAKGHQCLEIDENKVLKFLSLFLPWCLAFNL
jgi:hypothetical protein